MSRGACGLLGRHREGLPGMRIRDESISMERLDGETILINFDTGQYFSFRGPAADLLWLIEQGVERALWTEILARAFTDAPSPWILDQQISTFISELLEADIINETAGVVMPSLELPSDYSRGGWTNLEVKAHLDLVDLLVIDPIHDAGDDGWPQSRSS